MSRGTPGGFRPQLLTYQQPRGVVTGSSGYSANLARLQELRASVDPLYIAEQSGTFTQRLEGVNTDP
jgi:hypothetical protein